MSLTASKPDKAHGAHRHSPASVLYRMLRHPVSRGTMPGDEDALRHLYGLRVVEYSQTYRSGDVENYRLAQRVPQDVYRLAARIAGGPGRSYPDTVALAVAIVSHVMPELDADLAGAAAAAAEEYDGYARSGEHRVWTAEEIEHHVQDFHHVRTMGRRIFGRATAGEEAGTAEGGAA